MTLDQATLQYIQNVLKAASIAKISNIIIEPDRVRAIDDNRSVIILHTENVPEMPFGSIGINRINVFADRLQMAQSASNFTADVTIKGENTDSPWAQALSFKGKGIKVDYRCANPLTIQAPKSMNDTREFQMEITNELVDIITKGQTAMKAEAVAFIGDDTGVHIEMSDINGDTLSYDVSSDVDKIGDGAADGFNHSFNIRVLLPIIKARGSKYITFTSKGFMNVKVSNLNFYLVPNT